MMRMWGVMEKVGDDEWVITSRCACESLCMSTCSGVTAALALVSTPALQRLDPRSQKTQTSNPQSSTRKPQPATTLSNLGLELTSGSSTRVGGGGRMPCSICASNLMSDARDGVQDMRHGNDDARANTHHVTDSSDMTHIVWAPANMHRCDHISSDDPHRLSSSFYDTHRSTDVCSTLRLLPAPAPRAARRSAALTWP